MAERGIQELRPNGKHHGDGPFSPFIERLKPHLPPSFHTLPVADVLQELVKASPEIFSDLDQFITTILKVSELSDELATAWKQKGNEAFGKASFLESATAYTRGLLSAETDEMCATLLNNRSASFLQLHRFADACVDAHKCLQLKVDYWKALHTRGTCLEQLGLHELGKKDVLAAEAKDLSLANSSTDLEPLLKASLEGMAPHSVPPNALISPSIRVGTLEGRCVVAKTTITSGTVLEETPSAVVCKEEALLSSCSFCLQHTSCLYQGREFREAKKKSRGLFCSDLCASGAWKYYNNSDYFHPFFLCCPDEMLLAFRLKRTPQYPPTIGTPAVDESFYGAIDSFESLLAPKSVFSRELYPVAVVGGSETIVSALGLYMNAFTSSDADELRTLQRFVSINGVDVTFQLRLSKPNQESKMDTTQTSTITVGRGFYAMASLFNHSCDPNCYISFVGNPQGSSAKLVVRVIRPVEAGEELRVAYGGITRYKSHSTKNRLQQIVSRFSFVCNCETCISSVDERVTNDDKEMYVKASDYYQKGSRLIREGNFSTAVTVLLQSYEIVMRYICPPPRKLQPMIPTTHQALALAYFHLNDRVKSAEHLREALRTDVLIHGTDVRPEMIHSYSRLSSVVTDKAERETHGKRAVELMELFYPPSPLLTLTAAHVRRSYEA